MSLETITPQIAEQMLAHNTKNRSVQKTTVIEYARLITAGLWQLNGDAIRFAADGTLLDGQHRLAACVLANLPLRTWVARGFPIEAQATMDQQRKRTAGNVLAMNDIPQGNKLAAVVRMIHRWDSGERSVYGFGGTRTGGISAAEILVVAQTEEIYSVAMKYAGNSDLARVVTPRVSGALFILATRIDPQETDKFFSQIVSGAGLSEGHPVLTLRRHWLRNSDRQQRAGFELMAGVRGWNAYAEGRNLSSIVWRLPVIPELSKVKARPQGSGESSGL